MGLEAIPALSAPGAAPAASSPVLRNAVWLVAAQVLAMPLSVLVNALAGRLLGPADFGTLYLATTYAGFAVLFIDWGQFAALTGKVAENRSRAGELLGSSIVLRVGAALVVATVGLALCGLAGYGRQFLSVMALSLAVVSLGSLAAAGQDAIRGFERTDFAALSYVGQQLLLAVVSIGVLTWGLRLQGMLIGQVACALMGALFVLCMLPRLGIAHLRVRAGTIAELLRDGRPFLVFVLVMQLQALVDGAMMARFASADAIGWYAASRKLTGILVFPLNAVGSALYPTLVRQSRGDMHGYRSTVHGALRVLSLAVFPVALGCALFPDLGVSIFSTSRFAPAEQNLRVLAVYLFMLYFTIPLSTCINASGRSSAWAGVQFACVLVSAVADPLLIRWFAAHGGNGGLGVCIASAGSEVLMLAGAVVLIPKGVLDWSMLRTLRLPALAGVAMAAVGLMAGRYGSLPAAILAVMTYVIVLWVTGAVTVAELRTLLPVLRNRRR